MMPFRPGLIPNVTRSSVGRSRSRANRQVPKASAFARICLVRKFIPSRDNRHNHPSVVLHSYSLSVPSCSCTPLKLPTPLFLLALLIKKQIHTYIQTRELQLDKFIISLLA